jgi:acetyl-CoA carboxylase biotin carboxyl carrier protein
MSDKSAPAKMTEEADPMETVLSEPSLNLGEIRELAELVSEYGFTDFRFENEKIKVRLSKQIATTAYVQREMPAESFANASHSASGAQQSAVPDEPLMEDDSLHTITSPIVGTFYRSPGPDKDPYVQEGSKVTPESVVCIVEAMKLMNEIQAETSGEVIKIYVENGQPVEYGQALFGIKK